MLRTFSHLAPGVIALLIHLSGGVENLCAEEQETRAIESYLSRLVPIEQEMFGLLEREWRTARNLDELERSERFRVAMLGYLDRGLHDERVHPLIPHGLNSIFDSRKNLATRELQSQYDEWIGEAEAMGNEVKVGRLAVMREALTASTPPLGLTDAYPDRYRVRAVGALERENRHHLTPSPASLNYSRSLSRISLGDELFLRADPSQRLGQLFLARGEPRRGYLAVEFAAGDDPGKYFFGVYEHDRQVAAISLRLEPGILYRWRFDLDQHNATVVFELHDEQSRRQRLFVPWKHDYEMGFGASIGSPRSSARLMLILLPSSLPG